MNEFPRDCTMWLEALEAKYDGKGRPFERKQWDKLLGRYRVSEPTVHNDPLGLSPVLGDEGQSEVC